MDRWVVHSAHQLFLLSRNPSFLWPACSPGGSVAPAITIYHFNLFFLLKEVSILAIFMFLVFFPLDPASSLRDSSVTVAFFLKLVYFKRKGKKRRKDNGIAKWLPGHVTDLSPTLYSVIKPDVFNIYYHSDCLSSAPASPLKSSMTVYELVHLTLLGHNTISAVGTPQWVFQNHSEECIQSSWRDARHIVIDGFPCSIWMEIKNR